jgi:hypothetical protein
MHRLKDLEDPVRIFQLRAAGLQAGFPPLRTVPGEQRRGRHRRRGCGPIPVGCVVSHRAVL